MKDSNTAQFIAALETQERQIRTQNWLIGVSITVLALALAALVVAALLLSDVRAQRAAQSRENADTQRHVKRLQSAGEKQDGVVQHLLDLVQKDLNLREHDHARPKPEQSLHRPGSH